MLQYPHFVLALASKIAYNSVAMGELKIGPPPMPNRDKFPFVGTTRFRNMTIDIENLDGSVRSGVGPDGKPWKTLFDGALYGEIRHSKGTDGDPVDVYLKNPSDDEANLAYIIHQNHPRNHPDKPGEYDEDKVILGVSSPEEAKELYLQHYSRKDFFRSLTIMGMEAFKRTIFSDSKGEKIAMIKIATVQDAYDLGVKIAFNLLGLKKLSGAPQAGVFQDRPGFGGLMTRGSPNRIQTQMVAGPMSRVRGPGGNAQMRPPETVSIGPENGANVAAPHGMPTQPAPTQVAATAAPRPAPAS